MNTQDRRNLANRKRKCQRRLARAKAGCKALSRPPRILKYEVSSRLSGVSCGGVPVLAELARAVGLPEMIDTHVQVFKERHKYAESDHVLALATMVTAGGKCPEDLARFRQDVPMLDALGVETLPHPTTAGDFLRRFDQAQLDELQKVFLQAGVFQLGACLPESEKKLGIVHADGTLSPTDAECMEGIGYSWKKLWGYHPLVLSLANTNQPLWVRNRPGNAVSAEGAAEAFDIVSAHLLQVYEKLLFAGDTDFSQTKYLDGWHETGRIGFVFGYDACQNLVAEAEALAASAWKRIARPERVIKTRPRTKPRRFKEEMVREMEFETIHTEREDVAEFEYQPVACRRKYRMVVVRKTLRVTKGQDELLPRTRYFFYITNLEKETQAQIVDIAHKRCDQENLLAQLKGQIQALCPKSNDLLSNWAWMVIASLAWSLKSWLGLYMKDEAERRRMQKMEYKSFHRQFIEIPVQVVRQARRRVLRVMGGVIDSVGLLLRTFDEICRLRRIRC